MDNKNDGIVVRQARPEDAGAIVALEQQVWGPLGTTVYGTEHVEAWFETHPEGLMVAEVAGEVVAFSYSQIVRFDFDGIDRFRDYELATDHGFTRKSHDPSGNGFHCITVCSTHAGSGRALVREVIDATERLGKEYTVSLGRISGFDSYLTRLENEGAVPADVTTEDVALWYAVRCAEIVGGKVWPSTKGVKRLDLPTPENDPVLTRYLRVEGAGLAAVIPGCMNDPQSRDFAGMVIRPASEK